MSEDPTDQASLDEARPPSQKNALDLWQVTTQYVWASNTLLDGFYRGDLSNPYPSVFLSAFAVELALKSVRLAEGAWFRPVHQYSRLYSDLQPETQHQLEEDFRREYRRQRGNPTEATPYGRAQIKVPRLVQLLENEKDAFQNIRYLESSLLSYSSGPLIPACGRRIETLLGPEHVRHIDADRIVSRIQCLKMPVKFQGLADFSKAPTVADALRHWELALTYAECGRRLLQPIAAAEMSPEDSMEIPFWPSTVLSAFAIELGLKALLLSEATLGISAKTWYPRSHDRQRLYSLLTVETRRALEAAFREEWEQWVREPSERAGIQLPIPSCSLSELLRIESDVFEAARYVHEGKFRSHLSVYVLAPCMRLLQDFHGRSYPSDDPLLRRIPYLMGLSRS